jgi:hypothetical protein
VKKNGEEKKEGYPQELRLIAWGLRVKAGIHKSHVYPVSQRIDGWG